MLKLIEKSKIPKKINEIMIYLKIIIIILNKYIDDKNERKYKKKLHKFNY